MRDQNPAESAASIDGSPASAPVDPATIPGPQTANLGDGANGRLNETLAAAIDAEWVRPEHDCDGTDDSCAERCPRPAYQRMGLDELRDAAVVACERIVREHTERAWDEGKRATWSALGAPFVWAAPENPYAKEQS